MRIISGKNRGRKLLDSKHLNLRPTTDANRENLFNILANSKIINEIGFELLGAKMLDIFCGTGAVSFEALSRGAESAILIDENRQHLEMAQKNAQNLGEENINFLCKKIGRDSLDLGQEFNLIFLDPPYGQNLLAPALQEITQNDLLAKNGLLIVEHEKKEQLPKLGQKLYLLEQRGYGKSIFSFCAK